jgi:uncharacterized Zn-binding protein involved in type VI secretion
MPQVSTKVDRCRGHDACPERPFETWSENVLAEGIEVTRENDDLQPHGCPAHVPHGAIVTRGFQTVKVNGRPVAYVGAAVSCPSGEVRTGRPTVWVGEGERIK